MGINPATAALVLQGINMLTNAGAGYLESKQQRKAQRIADEENRYRTAYANLQNAFGGRAVPSLVNPQVRSSPTGNLLRTIGTAAGVGSTLIGANEAYKNTQAQNRLRDLQIGNAEMDRDRLLATTAAQAAPLGQEALRQSTPLPQNVEFDTALDAISSNEPNLLQTLGRRPQAPEGMSEYGQNVFDAIYGQREADQELRDLQMAKIQAEIKKTNAAAGAAGKPTLSGSNVLQIARGIGANAARINPFMKGAELKKFISEQSPTLLDANTLSQAMNGYYEQADATRKIYSDAIDAAAVIAQKTNYGNGLLALESQLAANGLALSESIMEPFLDRLDEASQVLNLDTGTKKRLAEMLSIRENAKNAVEALARDEVFDEVVKNFGRSSGAFAQMNTFFFGESEILGDEAAKFLNNLNFLQDTVARFRSGAALTDTEQKFYKGLIGSLTTKPEDLRLNLENLVNNINRDIMLMMDVENASRGRMSNDLQFIQ